MSVRATAAPSAPDGISPRIPDAVPSRCDRVMVDGYDALDDALYVAVILDEDDDRPRRRTARRTAVSPGGTILSPLVALLVVVVAGSLLLAVWPYALGVALTVAAVATWRGVRRARAVVRQAPATSSRHRHVS